MKDEKKVKLTLSASRVDTFKKCPRKYYYRYIKRLPTKDWPHFNLGTFVHGVLEHFHLGLLKDSKKKRSQLMKTSCINFLNQMRNDGKNLTNEQISEANEMLQNYLKTLEKDFSYQVLSLEEKFTLSLNEDYDFMGFVDRMDLEEDGTYHIKDYKTSKTAKYMKPFQLQAYGIWLMNKFPEIVKFRGSYIMMRLNSKYVSYEFNKEDVEKIHKELIEVAERIVNEERWPMKQSKLCDWCDFNNVCLNTWK